MQTENKYTNSLFFNKLSHVYRKNYRDFLKITEEKYKDSKLTKEAFAKQKDELENLCIKVSNLDEWETTHIIELHSEAVIMSGPLDDERMREAAKAAADEVTPITDLRCSASYRKEMVQVLTYRALTESMEKAKGGIPG